MLRFSAAETKERASWRLFDIAVVVVAVVVDNCCC